MKIHIKAATWPILSFDSKIIWGFPVGWWLHHSICPETHPHSLPCIAYIAHLIRLVYLSSRSICSMLCCKKSNLKFPKKLQNGPHVDTAMSLCLTSCAIKWHLFCCLCSCAPLAKPLHTSLVIPRSCCCITYSGHLSFRLKVFCNHWDSFLPFFVS